MRFSKILLISSFLLSTSAGAQTYWQAQPGPAEFCLQNFNVYGPIYASKVFERTERLTGFLQSLPKCDVVQFQEAWNDSQISLIENNLSSQYSLSTPNKEAKIGLMSLFMGDILGQQTVSFNVNNEGGLLDTVRKILNVKKAYHVVRARFHFAEEEFFFINTHLHPSSQAVRLTQVLDLLQWRLQNPHFKLILSGDFNSGIASLERRVVMLALGMHDAMEEYFGAYPKNYCTYCTGNPLGWMLSNQVFDYVFYSNVGMPQTSLRSERGEVNMHGTPRKPWSDHFGVRVKFSLQEGTSIVPDRDFNEKRRQQALRALGEVQNVLMQEKSDEFKSYVRLVRDLTLQLQNRQGPFASYFEKYR